MQTSVETATPITSVCLACGVIKKSGKLSCCARGGSWFGNCGATRAAQREHTWYEGLHACKARQSQAEMDQQQKTAQENDTEFANDTAVVMKAGVVGQMLASTLANAQIPATTPINAHANTSHKTVAMTSARVPMDTSNVNTTAEHTPIAYDTDTATYKAIAYDTDTITYKASTAAPIPLLTQISGHVPTVMSLPTPLINSSMDILASRPMNSPPSSTNIGTDGASMRQVSAAPLPSASTSITARDCENFLSFKAATHIIILVFLIAC